VGALLVLRAARHPHALHGRARLPGRTRALRRRGGRRLRPLRRKRLHDGAAGRLDCRPRAGPAARRSHRRDRDRDRPLHDADQQRPLHLHRARGHRHRHGPAQAEHEHDGRRPLCEGRPSPRLWVFDLLHGDQRRRAPGAAGGRLPGAGRRLEHRVRGRRHRDVAGPRPVRLRLALSRRGRTPPLAPGPPRRAESARAANRSRRRRHHRAARSRAGGRRVRDHRIRHRRPDRRPTGRLLRPDSRRPGAHGRGAQPALRADRALRRLSRVLARLRPGRHDLHRVRPGRHKRLRLWHRLPCFLVRVARSDLHPPTRTRVRVALGQARRTSALDAGEVLAWPAPLRGQHGRDGVRRRGRRERQGIAAGSWP